MSAYRILVPQASTFCLKWRREICHQLMAQRAEGAKDGKTAERLTETSVVQNPGALSARSHCKLLARGRTYFEHHNGPAIGDDLLLRQAFNCHPIMEKPRRTHHSMRKYMKIMRSNWIYLTSLHACSRAIAPAPINCIRNSPLMYRNKKLDRIVESEHYKRIARTSVEHASDTTLIFPPWRPTTKYHLTL